MDSDRVKGKKKELEGQAQQQWGRAKDAGRDTWEDAKDHAEKLADDAREREHAGHEHTSGERR